MRGRRRVVIYLAGELENWITVVVYRRRLQIVRVSDDRIVIGINTLPLCDDRSIN